MKSSELEEKINEWEAAIWKIRLEINEVKAEGGGMLPPVPHTTFVDGFDKMILKLRKALGRANQGTYDDTRVRM